jgi:hypothetical protein
MLKNISKLEFQVGEKVYQFLCDMDSPLEHAKIALNEFQKAIDAIAANLKAQQQESQPEQVPDGDKQ